MIRDVLRMGAPSLLARSREVEAFATPELAALLQRPEVGAIVHPVRRNGVTVAMTGEEHRGPAGDLPEQEGRGRLAVRRAHHFAVGHRQG
jgi:hypothetical protein